MTNGGHGETRVSIPHNVRKIIQHLTKTLRHTYTDDFIYATLIDSNMNPKEAARRLRMVHDIIEIAGKHSVEDVYAMLKECNLDADEATQRLLYIDTFHVVKKKHDRRKNTINDAFQENNHARGNPWRGDKGGRGNFYLPKVSEDGGGGRNLNSGKESAVTNSLPRVLRPALPGHTGKENSLAHTSNSRVNGTPALSNGGYSIKPAPELSAGNVNVTPVLSNGSYNIKPAPKLSADVPSSTSDNEVVSSQNTKHVCAVGTIKCVIVKRGGSDESNARISPGVKFSADQLGTATIPLTAEATDSELKPNVAETNPISESSQPLLVSTQNSSQDSSPIQDNQQPPQSLNVPLKDILNASENTGLVAEEESNIIISTPKHDVMIEKLTSSRQAVIFPDHLQVPENYKCQFIFGSLDDTPDESKAISVTESTQQDEVVNVTESTQQDEVVKEYSPSNENVSTIAQEGEIEDRVSEDIFPSDNNILSDASAQEQEQTKAEITPSPISTGFQSLPALQTIRDYGYGYMPPLMSPHFVQVENIPELQNGNPQVVSAVSQSHVTQPSMSGQSSIALSPPLFPYFRPYANYIPYNPYFPHMYLPQNAHLLNHGVFPQPSTAQQPTPNVHHVQGAAEAVVTSPTSQNKEETNENVTTSEAKDNNTPSTVQQGEDPQAWARAPVHDLPNLLPNYYYNFPQHMAAFSPLQAAALYHASQTMTAQPTLQLPLMYQQQPTNGTVEPTMQSSTSYHQHLHAPQVNQTDTALRNTGTS